MSKVFIVRFSRYSIYKVQFASRSRGQLVNTNTQLFICQELFSSFFKFLLFVRFFVPPLRTALIYYQIFLLLSSTFSSFFNFLLESFSRFQYAAFLYSGHSSVPPVVALVDAHQGTLLLFQYLHTSWQCRLSPKVSDMRLW